MRIELGIARPVVSRLLSRPAFLAISPCMIRDRGLMKDVLQKLWGVTCYFNPNGYNTKLKNYKIFKEALEHSGVPLLTVECAFGDDQYNLPDDDYVIKVRAHDVLWQKERLLNIALSHLPPSCSKVLWLDADVLFENPSWAEQTASLLNSKAVVQPFDRVVRLPEGHIAYHGDGEEWQSFADAMVIDPDSLLKGDFSNHGHTGFAWAANRNVLEKHGFYDACISGSGDHMMAHAFAGDWESPCIDRILGANNAHRAHFARWARPIYPEIRAKIGTVPGRLLHLWHGDHVNRRYVLRNQELARFGFDPERDIRISQSGCWEWASDRPELHQWARDYYAGRKEDG